MKQRVKARIKREFGKAKGNAGSAVRSAAKGKFREAGGHLKAAGKNVKMGLFGQRSGVATTSRDATVVRDGQLQQNTRNRRSVIGKDVVSFNQTIPKGGGEAQLTERKPRNVPVRKTRNRSEAARKAAITRKAKGK